MNSSKPRLLAVSTVPPAHPAEAADVALTRVVASERCKVAVASDSRFKNERQIVKIIVC